MYYRNILIKIIMVLLSMSFITACNGVNDIDSANVIEAGTVINCVISKKIGQDEYYLHHIKDANEANELMLSYGIEEAYIELFSEEFFENSELILVCYPGNPYITYKVNGINIAGDAGIIDIEVTKKVEAVHPVLQYSALIIEVENDKIPEETKLCIEWGLELAN